MSERGTRGVCDPIPEMTEPSKFLPLLSLSFQHETAAEHPGGVSYDTRWTFSRGDSLKDEATGIRVRVVVQKVESDLLRNRRNFGWLI